MSHKPHQRESSKPDEYDDPIRENYQIIDPAPVYTKINQNENTIQPKKRKRMYIIILISGLLIVIMIILLVLRFKYHLLESDVQPNQSLSTIQASTPTLSSSIIQTYTTITPVHTCEPINGFTDQTLTLYSDTSCLTISSTIITSKCLPFNLSSVGTASSSKYNDGIRFYADSLCYQLLAIQNISTTCSSYSAPLGTNFYQVCLPTQ